MRLIRKLRAVSIGGDERGVVLVTALMVMLVLLPLGLVFLSVSITENTISSNQATAMKAFQLADAGVEHAKQSLTFLDPSDVLDGTTGIFGMGKGKGAGPINTANLADGSYTVLLTNNMPANGFPRGSIAADAIIAGACAPSDTKDCDRIVVVSATGTYQGSQRTVEMIVQVPGRIPGAIYMMDGPDAGGPVEVEDLEPPLPLGAAAIDGNDCNPPSAGGGPGSEPAQSGIAVQSPIAQGNVVADIGVANPLVIGVNPASDVRVVPDGLNDDEFQAWVQTLMAQATPFGTGACGGPGNPTQFGTPAAAQICWGTGNMSAEIPVGSSGAGILIFNDFTPVGPLVGAEVTDFTYEGIVIVLGDGRFRMDGTSRIYGALIQKNLTGSHSGETRLRLRGDSRVCYSSMMVQNVQQILTPARRAWYERAQ